MNDLDYLDRYTARSWRKDNDEHDSINWELKDIAWKLYDLTCDYKELQLDARQLCCSGRYDNYTKHKRFSEKLKKVSATQEYKDYFKRRTEHEKDDFESSKRKYLEEFERTLENRRKRCLEELEEDMKKRKSQCKSRYSSYEGLSSEELERQLGEKLSSLQMKTQHMKDSLCSQPQPTGYEARYSDECCGRSGGSRNNVICCRGKQHLRNTHSPHRVYLDGARTYVVDHNNGKVIFVPSACHGGSYMKSDAVGCSKFY